MRRTRQNGLLLKEIDLSIDYNKSTLFKTKTSHYGHGSNSDVVISLLTLAVKVLFTPEQEAEILSYETLL